MSRYFKKNSIANHFAIIKLCKILSFLIFFNKENRRLQIIRTSQRRSQLKKWLENADIEGWWCTVAAAAWLSRSVSLGSPDGIDIHSWNLARIFRRASLTDAHNAFRRRASTVARTRSKSRSYSMHMHINALECPNDPVYESWRSYIVASTLWRALSPNQGKLPPIHAFIRY